MKKIIMSCMALFGFVLLSYGQQYSTLTDAKKPKSITVSPTTGNIYYVETETSGLTKLTEFNPTNETKNTIVNGTASFVINAVTVSASGTIYYQVFESSTLAYSIYQYPTQTKVFDGTGWGLGEARSMTVSSTNDIYWVEQGTRIRQINLTNGTVSTVDISGGYNIKDVTVDSSGTLYFSGNLGSTDKIIGKWVGGYVGDIAGIGTSSPIPTSIDGTTATAATLIDIRIARDASTQFFTSYLSDGQHLFKIENNKIKQLTERILNLGVSEYNRLAVGSNGKFYISDYDNNRIVALDPSAPISPSTHSITGSVGVAGATVELWQTGTLITSAISDASGNYTLTNVPDGNYTVSPLKMGYRLSPVSVASVTVYGEDKTVDFSAISTTTTYPVTGQITVGGSPLSGVNVNIACEDVSVDITTDINGNFTYNAPVSGNYVLTFSKNDYTFSPSTTNTRVISAAPASISVIAVGDATSIYSITGNTEIYNVDMGLWFEGTLVKSVTSGITGDYSLTEIPAGTYTLTLTKAGYSFSPASADITITNGNQTQNFTPTQISTLSNVIAGGNGYDNVSGNGTNGDGGLATAAKLLQPRRVHMDSSGNIYFYQVNLDSTIRNIRKVDATTKTLSTVLTTGASNTFFVDNDGTINYLSGEFTVSKTKNGQTTLIAGGNGNCYSTPSSCGDGGQATNAKFASITAIARSPKTGEIFIADGLLNVVRKIDSSGKISTVAGISDTAGSFSGDGDLATQARLNYPNDIVIDSNGHLYIRDSNNNRIRKVDYTTKKIITVLGNGTGNPLPADSLPLGTGEYGTEVKLGGNLQYLSADSQGNVYLPMYGSGSHNSGVTRVYKLDSEGKIWTVIDTAVDNLPLNGYWVSMGTNGKFYFADDVYRIFEVTPQTLSPVVPQYSLSGNIQDGGNNLSGVTLNITRGGNQVGSVTTGTNGNYNIATLADGTYEITPSKAGYTFTPTSATITISGSNQTQNFTATVDTTRYPISGQILVNTLPLEDVNINISYEGNSEDIITDTSGNFSYNALTGGSYTLTFSKAGYNFNPASVTVDALSSAQVISTTAMEIIDTTISAEILPTSSGKGYVKCSSEPLKVKIKNAKAGNIGMKIFTGRQARLVKDQTTNNQTNGDIILEWDCSTQSGGKADSGVYMMVINGGGISNKKFKVGVLK